MKVRAVFRSKWIADFPPPFRGPRQPSSEAKSVITYIPPAPPFTGNTGGPQSYPPPQELGQFGGGRFGPPGLLVVSDAAIPGRHAEHGHFHQDSANSSSIYAQPQTPTRSRSEGALDARYQNVQLPRGPEAKVEPHGEEREPAQSKVPAAEALGEKTTTSDGESSVTVVTARVSLPETFARTDKATEVPEAETVSTSPASIGKKTSDASRTKNGKEMGPNLAQKTQQSDSAAHPNTAGGKTGRSGKGPQKSKASSKPRPSGSNQVAQPGKQPQVDGANLVGGLNSTGSATTLNKKSTKPAKFTDDEIEARRRDSQRVATPMPSAQRVAAASQSSTVKEKPQPFSSLISQTQPSPQHQTLTNEQGVDIRTVLNQCDSVKIPTEGGKLAELAVGDVSHQTGDLDTLALENGQLAQDSQVEEQSKTDTEVTRV